MPRLFVSLSCRYYRFVVVVVVVVVFSSCLLLLFIKHSCFAIKLYLYYKLIQICVCVSELSQVLKKVYGVSTPY